MGSRWRRVDVAAARSDWAARASAAAAGAAPARRLRAVPTTPRSGASRSARVARCGKFLVPQRHVEGRMLAAHEAGATRAIGMPQRERQQHQRPALGIVGDHDEGGKTLMRADMALPGRDEVEALKGRAGLGRLPGRARSPRRWRDRERVRCWRCGLAFDQVAPPSGFRSRQPWSSQNLCCRKLFTIFGFGRPSQGNVNKE